MPRNPRVTNSTGMPDPATAMDPLPFPVLAGDIGGTNARFAIVPDADSALVAFDPADDFQAQNTARTLDPRTLAIEMDKLLPADRNLVYDAGNFLIGLPYLSVPGPGQFKLTSDFLQTPESFCNELNLTKKIQHQKTND